MFKRKPNTRTTVNKFELRVEKYKEYLEAPIDFSNIYEKIQQLEDYQAVELAKMVLYEYLLIQRTISHDQKVNKLDSEFIRLFYATFSDALHNIPGFLDEPEELKQELVYFFRDLEATRLFIEECYHYQHLFSRFLGLKTQLDEYVNDR